MKNRQGVGNATTKVTSFDITDGTIHWEITDQNGFPSQPGYGAGLVCFVTGGRLQVLDAVSGNLKYTVALIGGSNGQMPTIHEDSESGDVSAYVYAGSHMKAIDLGATEGQIRWSQFASANDFSIPTIVGDSVVVSGYAFDRATGAANRFDTRSIGTTVSYDENLRQLYVVAWVDNTLGYGVTAYSYKGNDSITQLWQSTGAGISRASVAIGPGGHLYAVDSTTIIELDPTTGNVLRSLGGQSLVGGVAPIISEGFLWTSSKDEILVYDLLTFSHHRTLPTSRGGLNPTFDSPGAMDDSHFIIDYGTTFQQPGFEVWVVSRSFIRGDASADGVVNLDDAILILDRLFGGGSGFICAKAGDSNDDGKMNVLDAINVLLSAFRGKQLPEPFQSCGADPTKDALSCESFPPCM